MQHPKPTRESCEERMSPAARARFDRSGRKGEDHDDKKIRNKQALWLGVVTRELLLRLFG